MVSFVNRYVEVVKYGRKTYAVLRNEETMVLAFGQVATRRLFTIEPPREIPTYPAPLPTMTPMKSVEVAAVSNATPKRKLPLV